MALELCNFVLRNGSSSASKAAESLGKSLSTTLQSMQGLEKLGILSSKKTGRERMFEARNRGRLQSVLGSEIVRSSAAKTGRLKDRMFPLLRFEDSLMDKLTAEMGAGTRIRRETRVETGLIDTRVDLVLESKKHQTVLDVSRLVHPKDVYAAIGKIITVLGSDEKFDGMLAVLLLHPQLKLQLPRLNIWRIKQLVNDTIGQRAKFDIVTDFSTDVDLLDKEYAERVGDQIGNRLRNLYQT